MLIARVALIAAAFPLVSATPSPPQTCSAPSPVPATVTTPNSTFYTDGMPPERFRANRKITVQLSTQDEINDICGKAPCNMLTLGCQQPKQLILPNPCTYGAGDKYARLVCHELAHLNGWPATHGS